MFEPLEQLLGTANLDAFCTDRDRAKYPYF